MSDGLPAPIDLRRDGRVEVAGRWELADGAELRLVRYWLRGAARQLLRWARHEEYAPYDPELDAGEWLAGVALEERESPRARWQSIRRQEIETNDLDRSWRRLRGWEAGLAAHAEKRVRRRATGPVP